MLTDGFDHSGKQRADREGQKDAQGPWWGIQTGRYPGSVRVAIVTRRQQKAQKRPQKC